MLTTRVKKVLFSILALMLFTVPRVALADWSVGVNLGGPGDHYDHEHDHDHDRDHHYYGWHDHPNWGYHIHYLPFGYNTIWVGGQRYYYYDGLYYTYVGDGDYVIVNPPIGAYVAAIPPDFQPVSINGRIYYTSNGVYYLLTEHHGYKVVEPPVVYAQPAPVVVEQPQQVVVTQAPAVATVPVDSQDSFPINVPNNSGGYTTVVIKKSGNGYVGPQGEFYASFPSIAQLKAMYVK